MCTSRVRTCLELLKLSLNTSAGLVALQTLSRSEDRAVATSTRNLLRALGAVIGVAVSTAAQYAVTASSLRNKMPQSLLSQVLVGSWQIGESGTEQFEDVILNAKMRGFRVVFIIFVPMMMVVCSLGMIFVSDVPLRGDKETNEEVPSDKSARLNPLHGC